MRAQVQAAWSKATKEWIRGLLALRPEVTPRVVDRWWRNKDTEGAGFVVMVQNLLDIAGELESPRGGGGSWGHSQISKGDGVACRASISGADEQSPGGMAKGDATHCTFC